MVQARGSTSHVTPHALTLTALWVFPSTAGAQPPAAPKPELPKVVLVGDSIRLGCAPLVARRLEGKARVVSAEANGGGNVLAKVHWWGNRWPAMMGR